MRATPDDILCMAFFARVVEARSFSEAARALGVSKSAVSARVARLEQRLGVRLLHRTTRRLALTADGVRLYERCARVAAEADEAAEVAAGASDVPRGTLRVHAAAGFGLAHLPKPIGEFMRLHPGVRVDLRLSDRIPDLTVDQLDVAVVVAGRLPDSGMTTRKLAAVRVAVCAAPAYLRRKGIPFRPQDLVLHDCVSHSVRQGADDLRFQTDEGAVSMASLSSLVVDDSRFLREAALAGLGIAMLPELLVFEDLAAGRLHRVLDDFQTIELGVHALHPHGRLPPASVRAFLDHLASWFRELPWERRPTAPLPPRARKAGTARSGPPIAMTEQDVRRLTAVAELYAEVDAESSAELVRTLGRVKTLPAAKIPRTTVTMSSRVRAIDERGEERELSLVYPWDVGRDRVSVTSALGLALLGASVGARIEDGRKVMKIGAIPYQPEAAGDHHL
ncbi:MAG: LysR family transcriptional regulator [Labilithrix sp.]|nr:LysR family transcriptional regulator [Labilithrix sp.]